MRASREHLKQVAVLVFGLVLLPVESGVLLPPDESHGRCRPNSRATTKRTVSQSRSRIGAYTSAASILATRNHGESGTARTAASTGTPR